MVNESGASIYSASEIAREEFPEGGPYADRIAALMQTACRLLMPYRRWVV